MLDAGNRRRERCGKIVFSAGRSHLIDSFAQLNLFNEDPIWSSTLNLSEQMRSTRLFLILICTSVFLVIVYSSLSIVKSDVNLEKFSIVDFERLEKRYPTTINAPCSVISIPSSEFLRLSPIFHEVCSSSFVSDRWISSLFLSNATFHHVLDFRTFGFAHFRSLRLLCRIARQAVKDAVRTFNSSHLINRYAFSRIQFEEISSVLLNNLQENVFSTEKRTMNVISMITARNRLMSGLRTNYYIQSKGGSRTYVTTNGLYLMKNQTNDSICDCRLNGNQCIYPSGIFSNWTLAKAGIATKDDPPADFQIVGIMGGCIPLDSMRQSTLECLYNQRCINLISLQPEICQAKSLNKSLTRFPVDSLIGSLFDQNLFVESWKNQSNFEKYFSACAPLRLSYSYEGRFDIERIVTLTISSFGGLVLLFKLITPVIIKIFNLIKKKKQLSISIQSIPIESEIFKVQSNNSYKIFKSNLYRIINNFNLFPSNNKDERIGITTTRLYLLLIFIGLIILSFYTYLSENPRLKVLPFPSLLTFEELNRNFPLTLKCPCSRFSMSYGRIMSFSPRYHSICSSEYLKDYWFSYFGHVELNLTEVYFLSTDFRVSGESFFALLQILCQMSKETIENALITFKKNRLVTMNVLSLKEFQIEIEKRFQLFEKQTISSFLQLIQLIRSSIQTNQLAEEMWTNLGPFSSYLNETSQWLFNFRSRDFYQNSCSCLISNQCIRSVGFYFQTDNVRDKANITVPGLVLTCFSIDSLLLSTFECFYEEECIQILIKNYYFNVTGLVRPLDNRIVQMKPLSNKNSRFLPNTTIDQIFSQLFIEDWFNSTNYSSYYERCKPFQCTYIIEKRFDLAYMSTIILGFYGGLSSLLEIILPPVVLLLLKRWIKTKQTESLTTDSTVDSSSTKKKKKKNCFSRIYKKVLRFKLFQSNSFSNEKEEIIFTRIYIFLLLLMMIIALLYYGPFNREMKLIEMRNVSIDLINDLHQKNLSSLSCPCSQVLNPYSQFLLIKAEFDLICSNEYHDMNQNKSLELITHYRLLSSLCSLSNDFVEDAIKAFHQRELITVETMTMKSFDTAMKSFISTFIRQTKSDYRRKILFVMNSFSVNQILNLFSKNWKMEFTDEDEDYILRTIPHRFSISNCTCAVSSNCHEPLNDQIQIGCFPYDGFRFSKYENISLELRNNRLFVHEWINQTNYTTYFQKCNPLKCQYKVPDKNNPLFMFTTLLGLYGGLTFFLYFIVGQSLLAYRWWTRTNAEVSIQSQEQPTSYL